MISEAVWRCFETRQHARTDSSGDRSSSDWSLSISASGCLWSLLASRCPPSGSLEIDWTSLNERGCVTIVDPADGVDCGVLTAAVSPTSTEAALGTHTIAVLGLVWRGVAQIRALLVVQNYADIRIHVEFAAADGSPSGSRR